MFWGLDEEVLVVGQMEGDCGGGGTAVGEAKGDSLLRADVNAVKLEEGLKRADGKKGISFHEACAEYFYSRLQR